MVVDKSVRQKNEATDEEQKEKFHEIVELLLAAGYFRARIKGLTPFDKVVGGMTWCISTCDFDVDVDLLFQENSTIGQKIALTEKIVAVLPRMKCPHRIEPHQIQGLDFINIYPVIQWLVKQAIETREEQGDRIRAYSISQFNKNHSFPADEERSSKDHLSISAIKFFKETYKPKRKYKKPMSYFEADEETQVHSTLLEYGHKYILSGQTVQKQKEMSSKQEAISENLSKVAEISEEDALEAEKKIQSLMEGMSETDAERILSSRTVGSIVGLKSDEISDIAEEYAKRQEALEEMVAENKMVKGDGALQVHKRQVASLKSGIEAEKIKLEQNQEGLETITKELGESKSAYEKIIPMKQRLEEEMELLDKQQNEESERKLAKLRGLVTQHEELKKVEQDFKAQCKLEKKELDEKVEALNNELLANQNVDSERVKAISEQLEGDNKKLRKMRLLLGKKNREIAGLQWKIDDVPSRAELAQYQRRFIELYNQVASTHKETKQFYSLYNTLDDKKIQLDREVGILNSIHDGFGQAVTQSLDSRNEFLEQLEKISAGVKQNLEISDKKMQSEKEKRDILNSKWIDLNERKRLYFKTVRDFQEECKKSELIQSKMKSMEEGR